VLTDRAHGWIEPKQGPIAARNGEVLLLHAEAHVDAVGDALAIGQDQGCSYVSFRLAERVQRLLRVGAHGDLRNVDIAIGDRLESEVLARDALAGGRELSHGSEGRRLRRLAAGV